MSAVMERDHGGLLYQGVDWTFDTIRRAYDAIEAIGVGELGLDLYRNRIEVISSEQMLDVYTSHGMPLIYKHWSFGKRFIGHESAYRRGQMGLAYEVVINADPCISYLMEENSATMQALVIAHAAFGHNHFFKNNRVFRQWTSPAGILDYLEFARGYIATCEDRHGQRAVERILDAAHALQGQGVHRFSGARPLDLKAEAARDRDRRAHAEQSFNDLWRTLPNSGRAPARADPVAERRRRLGLPEENVLYFLEKSAPRLAGWEREVIRIVRLIAQYFYPQPQVKMMNEGCATWTHQHIMDRLHRTGRIDDAAYLEVMHSTTNVITQPGYEHSAGQFNPYALGYAMMTDIARICDEPTEEDRSWFPEIAGNGAALDTLKHAWAEFRDESFILQYLSPALMRKFRMFRLLDDAAKPYLLVDAIHDREGYREIRRALSRSYDPSRFSPDIQIVDVDLDGDRTLHLEHRTRPGHVLHKRDADGTLRALADLWGYEVKLLELDEQTEAVLARHAVSPSEKRH